MGNKTTEVWEWFAAALIHDLGKTILDAKGSWGGHRKLDVTRSPTLRGKADLFNFESLLGAGILIKVESHHDQIVASSGPGLMATVVADRTQKAMHQMCDEKGRVVQDGDSRYESLMQAPPFYPYYGDPILAWDSATAAGVLQAVVDELALAQGKLTLKVLLNVQRQFRCYPHTSFMAHLSLAFHHRFTAVLFYVVHEQLATLKAAGRSHTDLTALQFAVINIAPEPLALFYRLRDVSAYRAALSELRRQLFDRVFAQHWDKLPDLAWDNNPFEFFTGDSIVLVYHRPEAILDGLQEIIEGEVGHTLRALSARVTEYKVSLEWHDNGGLKFVDPEKISTQVVRSSLFAPRLLSFPAHTLVRCRRCNEPVMQPGEGELCGICARLMERPGIIDLHQVAAGPDPESEEEWRLAYVFLTLPPLGQHARMVASSKLLPQMKRARVAFEQGRNAKQAALLEKAPDLQGTKLGLFEYLQAVMAMDAFRLELEQHSDRVYPIARFPELVIYVMREDRFLDFFDHLDNALAKMRLTVLVRAILCHPKMPIWSLMDHFADYDERGESGLYDTTGGEIIVFNAQEVQVIRDLAREGPKATTAAQMHALVMMARRAGPEELALEIDKRTNKRNIRGWFAKKLKEGLGELQVAGDEGKDKDKDKERRALFLKNIVDLGRFRG